MQPELRCHRLRLIEVDGLRFKDHDGNGRLDPYEDWRRPPLERARDLLARMTLEEKAGAMLHANPPALDAQRLPGAGSAWDPDALRERIVERRIGTFLNRLQAPPGELARQANALQAIAEEGRLGIPCLLSSDPRSHFGHSQGVSVAAGGFTRWPDAAGFGAIDDAELVRAFADCVRQEYRAVGIRMALSPMADLALQPRWHRNSGCFGSNPGAVQALVGAYVRGMQAGDNGLHAHSVVSVVKHWVGYGATGPEGFDAHNHYGRHLHLDDSSIEDHIAPFTGAFDARVGGVMPAYGMPPKGLRVAGADGSIAPVGMGFNRAMITDVLRGRFGFGGIVMSDWHITDDCTSACLDGAAAGQSPGPQDIAMPWGVEHLSKAERFARAIHAGVDQFGGADDPRCIIAAVRAGLLSEALLDTAVLRLLVQKFQLGLFENPYVDADAAADAVATARMHELSLQAQRRSVVLAKHAHGTLPLRSGTRLYVEGLDADAARAAGFDLVQHPADAELAVIGLCTPHELLHPGHFFGSRYREGRIGWQPGDADLERLRAVAAQVPTIASVYLERPADLAAIEPLCAAVVLHFGLQGQALFEVLAGQHRPAGRLPYDLPWSGPTPRPGALALQRGQGLTFLTHRPRTARPSLPRRTRMKTPPAPFVLVAGSGHGGWAWRELATLLTQRGHRVYAPSLTGLADRSHLMSGDITLHTHVQDVVNLFRWEDLRGAVLVVHSYAGWVASAAAEAIEDRLAAIAFVDAFLPENGQRGFDLLNEAQKAAVQEAQARGDVSRPGPTSAALRIQREEDARWLDAKITPQPIGVSMQPVVLTGARERVPRKLYVRTPLFPQPLFDAALERCRATPGWQTAVMNDCGHDPMIDAPQALAPLLLGLLDAR